MRKYASPIWGFSLSFLLALGYPVKGNGVCLPCLGITARERRADDSYLSRLDDGRIKSRLEDGQVRAPCPYGSAVQLPGEKRPCSMAAV